MIALSFFPHRKDYCLQGFQFDTILGAAIHLPHSLGDLFSPAAFTICIQWLLFQVLLDRILPGKVRHHHLVFCSPLLHCPHDSMLRAGLRAGLIEGKINEQKNEMKKRKTELKST